MVLCALHEPNYNLKAIIVAIIMSFNNYYGLVSNCFISDDIRIKNKLLKNEQLNVSNNVNIIADRKRLSLPHSIGDKQFI